MLRCPAHQKLISLSHGGHVIQIPDEVNGLRLHVGSQMQQTHKVQVHSDGAVWADITPISGQVKSFFLKINYCVYVQRQIKVNSKNSNRPKCGTAPSSAA